MKGLYRTALVGLLLLSPLGYAESEPAASESPGVIEQLLNFFGLADEAEGKPADATAAKAKLESEPESTPEPTPELQSLSPPAQEQLSAEAGELLPIQPLDLRLPEGADNDDAETLAPASPSLPNLFGKSAQPKVEPGRISVSGKPLLKFGETYTDTPKVEGADFSVEMKID